MKESIRRIQQERHSESLLKLVKRMDNMSLGVEYMKTYNVKQLMEVSDWEMV